MTNEETIKLCREHGWQIEKAFRCPHNRSRVCYDIGWPAGATEYDYRDWILAGEDDLAVLMAYQLASAIGDNVWHEAGFQVYRLDEDTIARMKRARAALEETLDAITDCEREQLEERLSTRNRMRRQCAEACGRKNVTAW